MDQQSIIISASDSIFAMYIESQLKNNGFTNLKKFLTYEETIKLIDIVSPSLLLIDISYHDQEKWLSFIDLINRRVKIPVIVITTIVSQDFYKSITEAGVIAILNKPVDSEYLIKSVNSALKKV